MYRGFVVRIQIMLLEIFVNEKKKPLCQGQRGEGERAV
jgi:hypothetical protein